MDLHYIQDEILLDLATINNIPFSKFKIRNKIEDDKLNYHLKTLIDLKLVNKSSENLYSLSTAGKKYISVYDFDNKRKEKMPKVSVMAIFYKGKGKFIEILISERLKSPFLNANGLVTGKVKIGESIEQAMIRECLEETGLTPVEYRMLGVERWIDYDSITKNLMNDAVFFVFEITVWNGDLIEKTIESFNKWCKISDLKNIPKKLPTLELISKDLYKNDSGKKVKFKERIVEIENF